MRDLVIGLDIGTGGARAVAVDEKGHVVSTASHLMPPPFMDSSGVSEQVPDTWEVAALTALGRCVAGLGDSGAGPQEVRAICVDGTSGTIVLLDKENRPLYPGLMHNDTRAFQEAAFLNDLMAEHCREVGYQFGATFALSKLLWMKRHRSEVFEKTVTVLHQADFIVAKLTGRFGVSDHSNALKAGYNLVADRWPPEMEELGFAKILPQVVPSGERVGSLQPSVAESLGLDANVCVFAGVTDSTAAFLATGASLPGEFCVSMGTTMALKGVSENLVHDPQGVVYCHRHPGGYWLPGGASNVGGACIKAFFPDQDLSQFDREAVFSSPVEALCYPLVEVGERFPFHSPDANGFFEPTRSSRERYLSLLQGVGLVERWCFERLERLGVAVKPPVYTAGGGANSETWNQIRANILQRPIAKSRSTDAAFGVTVLAGSRVFYSGDLAQATRKMTGLSRVYEPDCQWAGWAADKVGLLKQECFKRGWISPEEV